MYLRSYRPTDFEQLYALDAACFGHPFRFSRSMMRRVLRAEKARAVLACETDAEERESLLGFSAVNIQTEGARVLAYLATLDVNPAYQRRGIGRVLMEATEEQLAYEGVSELLLHVYVNNSAAIGLYHALGYQELQLERSYYGSGMDAWVYGKRLGLP